MARITPPLSHRRPASLGDYAEQAVLRSLADGLDDRFHVLHGVDWVVADGAADHHGELDVVVVNSAGDVALLEVKSGALSHDGKTLRKTYGSESKDVEAQARRQFNGVLHRLKSAGLGERVLHLLVLTGLGGALKSLLGVAGHPAGIDRAIERLVDLGIVDRSAAPTVRFTGLVVTARNAVSEEG
jgi:hypothetical protein